LTVNKEILHYW